MGANTNVVQLPSNERSCFICKDTTEYKIARCINPTCSHYFCTEHASKSNLLYCEHCMIDVTVVETTFQRTEEHYDEDTDTVVTTKTTPIKQISFQGADWTFMTECIRNLSDDELRMQLQVLRGGISLMENELTQRKIKKQIVARDQHGNILRTSTNTTVTKTVKTRSSKPVDLKGLADRLKGLNLTPEQMAALLSASK